MEQSGAVSPDPPVRRQLELPPTTIRIAAFGTRRMGLNWPCQGERAASPPFFCDEQIGHRDGLVAVGARTTRPHAAAEDAAIRAALHAEEAGFAGWAFVDGGGAGGAPRDRDHECRMPPAPDSLAAGGRADALASPRAEGLP